MALSALPLQALEFAMDPGLEEASRAMALVVEQFRSFDESQMKGMLGAGAGDRASVKLQELTTHLAQIHGLLWSAQRADDDKRSPPAARLRDLRDAIYHMEDMVDEMEFHKLKFQVEKGAKVGSANPLFSALKFGKRLVSSRGDEASRSRLLKDLDFIASQVRNLIPLLEKAKGASSNPPLAVPDVGAPKATPVPLEDQKVFGRDNELDDILQMLIEPPSSRHDQPTYSIISIVGIGGLGKTTLAHSIYNDARVNRHFDLRAWALVSDACDKMKITKRILRSASPTYHGSTENEDTFETLQLQLNRSVSSKKLLLVLDDIREESFTNMACQEILNPLRCVESGSRILVTTRTNTVAVMLGTSHTYHLNALGTEDCWSLFKECAFGGGKIHHSTDELEQIARKIATKLNGSPLAAKMLGGLVGATKPAKDWRNILNTEFCGDTTLSSLQLSYNYLPGQLKQCFAYCSLFPKDQEFDQRDLIHQWVAQGFIRPQSGADKRMEDLAKDYFDELVSRSFFNVHRQGSKTHYSMHDLVYDLARSVSEDSCVRIEQGNICDIPSTVRHLSVTADGLQGLKSFCKLEKLRTLVITRPLPFFSSCFQDDLLGKTRNLRVLDLSCFNLRELPDTIGEVSHLRYLSLCGTVQRLPESVSKLLHLQSLCFSDKCSLDKLPVGTSMLVNLRHLDIDMRYIAQVVGIGQLVNLQGSVEFHVKKEGGRTLEELKGLNCLRGQLKIKGLDNALGKEEARKAELNKKRNLRVLKLEWTSASRNIVSDADAEILENLQPHSSIMELQIERYLGTTAPSWLQLAMLKELRSLHLTNCRSMNILPPLGLLPSLKDLHMKELCTVSRIGHEFYGKDDVPFPSLRVLVFDDFPSLLSWTDEVKGNPFPCLKRLKLIDCPKLIQVPPFPLSVSEATVERTLLISYMRLAQFSSSRSEVLTLDVSTTTVICRGLFHQRHLESIISLKIKGCKKLVATEGLCSLTSLQRLQLCHCDLTDSTFNRILYAIPSLSSLEMMDLPNITSLLVPTELNFFTQLAELHISNCQLLSSVVSLHTLISLKRLVIERCPKLTEESFPINFWSLTSLKHSAFLDLDNNTSFFGVFDGHGGRVVAKFCAKYLHKEVLRSEAYTAGDLGTAVHRAFFRMDEMMRGQRGWRELQALGDKINQFTGMIEGLIWSPRGSDSNDEHDDWAFEEGPHSDFTGPTCGCTACVAIVRNSQLVVANAGDSRCVISRNGQAYNLSRDHKPELEAERERIVKAGGYIQMGRVNGTINLSRAIGDMEYKQNKFLSPDKQILTADPDINIVELCDDDEFLVLACDGIWDCMSSQHLVDVIHEHINTESSLSAVCERVLDRCLAPSTLGGEGCDNMTMILVQFTKPINQNKNASSGEQSSGDTELSETNAAEENGS